MRDLYGLGRHRTQKLNVFRMRLNGAEVKPVSPQPPLKDAINEAFRDWVRISAAPLFNGFVVGPHPYPSMVRDFQSVIGKETGSRC